MSKNPCVLLLGQQHLILQDERDPFLSQIVRRYCIPGTIPDDYSKVLESAGT
jgi:hypothetical protein